MKSPCSNVSVLAQDTLHFVGELWVLEASSGYGDFCSLAQDYALAVAMHQLRPAPAMSLVQVQVDL